MTGFNLAAHIVTQPGDCVLIQDPAYGSFCELAENSGIHHHSTSLSRKDTDLFWLNADQILADIQDNIHLFMLCNPQIPIA